MNFEGQGRLLLVEKRERVFMVGEMCNQVFGGRNEHGFQHKQRQQTW